MSFLAPEILEYKAEWLGLCKVHFDVLIEQRRWFMSRLLNLRFYSSRLPEFL